MNFKSASASDSSFGASDAVIRLAGYGNVVTVGITNTFSPLVHLLHLQVSPMQLQQSKL